MSWVESSVIQHLWVIQDHERVHNAKILTPVFISPFFCTVHVIRQMFALTVPQHNTEKTTPTMCRNAPEDQPNHPRNNEYAWLVSFSAAMVPFTAFLYGHSRGLTVKVIESVARSPVGPAGLLLLPFVTLGMEKSIYDTIQAAQGIDANVIEGGDRGGFPSGGSALPSFSLIPVQQWSSSPVTTDALARRTTIPPSK